MAAPDGITEGTKRPRGLWDKQLSSPIDHPVGHFWLCTYKYGEPSSGHHLFPIDEMIQMLSSFQFTIQVQTAARIVNHK